MNTKLVHLILLICLFPMSGLAEDWEEDDDDDLEYFFSTRQKSTIDDFPLKEIGGDELSNAAIEGALQANSSSGLSAKPIYEQEKEESDKKKSGDALKKDELLKLGKDLPIDQFPISTPQYQQPIYVAPTGRTYGGLSTQTVERP